VIVAIASSFLWVACDSLRTIKMTPVVDAARGEF